MSAPCTPSRASFFTGQYPSLHGVTQTDGLAKDADSPEMSWLADDRSRMLRARMLEILIEQLAAKRLTSASGAPQGYRPPRN